MKVNTPKNISLFVTTDPNIRFRAVKVFASFMIVGGALEEVARIPAKKSEWLPMADFWVLSFGMS